MEIDAASHGGVDDARDLRERAFFAPVNSRYKVYIVDEAHMVTTQGFNALLKVVEEPPEFLVFVFATTEPDKVLPTIRSRTHHYPFRLVPPTTLRGLLEKTCDAEGVTVEPTVFPLVVRAGGGSVRDSLSILDQLLAGAGPEGVTYRSAVGLLGVTDDALLDETIDALAAHDAPAVFRAVDRVVEAGHDPRRFATDLLDRLRDLIVLDAVPHAGGNGLLDCPPDRLDLMSQQARALGSATLSRMADTVHDGPDRDAGDDGAAAAARARLRPHAPARDRRRRPSRPSSGSSASSGGCPSRASTPAVRSPSRRPARPPRPRGAGPRPGTAAPPPAAAAPPPAAPRRRRSRGPARPGRPQARARSTSGPRSAARPAAARAGRAPRGRRARPPTTGRRRCRRAPGPDGPPPPRSPPSRSPSPRARRAAACARATASEPDIPLPPEPTDDEDWPHPASPAAARAAADRTDGRRGTGPPRPARRRARPPSPRRSRGAVSRPRSSRPTPSRPPPTAS